MSWLDFCERNDVPIKYRNASIDNLMIPDDERGSYKKKAQILISKPTSCLLLGKAGRGKTYFQYALLRALIEKFKTPHEFRFFRSIDLDARLVECYERYRSIRDFLESIVDPLFLFIDDFGMGRDTAKAERDYFDLIDQRTSREKFTVFSSNLPEDSLHRLFGERIASRLKECTIIEFNGPDLREGIRL